MKCPYCGAAISDTANFCSVCSKKVREVCHCWVKQELYNCGLNQCPGLKIIIDEIRRENESKPRNLLRKVARWWAEHDDAIFNVVIMLTGSFIAIIAGILARKFH